MERHVHSSRGLVALALLMMAAAACGDDAGTTTAPPTTTTTSALVCPAPIAVDDPADIVAALAALPWRTSGQQTSGAPALTPDLVVTGTVVVTSADLPVPDDCLAESDCYDEAGFSGGAPGATLDGSVGPSFRPSAARLTLRDTTVRLRPRLIDTHPGEYNAVPVVDVEPPCGSPCGEGLALCPADGSCYARGDWYCRMCEGGSAAECACRAEDGSVLADGTSCSYWRSGDWQAVGACRQGVCEEE